MNENDVLGFDPMSLSVFSQDEASNKKPFSSNIYRPRPAESRAADGVYRATIKVIYNCHDLRQSVLEQQSYSMQDEKGWFSVVSSLTNNDTSCPIFKAWKKCHFAEQGSDLWKQAAKKTEGGRELFDKRYGRYVTIQVMKDNNHPELEGKFMFWKLPKSIWDIINAKMNPSPESGKAAIPVMDFLFGRSIDLEVVPGPDDKAHPERKTRETKYMGELSEEVVSCTNPDGSPLLNDAEQAVLDNYVNDMQKVWRCKDPETRADLLNDVNNDPNTKELRQIYARVLEELKKVCPNLVEELGYKEWDAETKARVDKWIETVLSCNTPKVDEAANVENETLNSVDVTPTPASSITANEPDETSDLPC